MRLTCSPSRLLRGGHPSVRTGLSDHRGRTGEVCGGGDLDIFFWDGEKVPGRFSELTPSKYGTSASVMI